MARVDGAAVFAVSRWFRLQSECEYFAIDQITEGQLQWFIDIFIYLQFVTG